jgi:hypothetical protein
MTEALAVACGVGLLAVLVVVVLYVAEIYADAERTAILINVDPVAGLCVAVLAKKRAPGSHRSVQADSVLLNRMTSLSWTTSFIIVLLALVEIWLLGAYSQSYKTAALQSIGLLIWAYGPKQRLGDWNVITAGILETSRLENFWKVFHSDQTVAMSSIEGDFPKTIEGDFRKTWYLPGTARRLLPTISF